MLVGLFGMLSLNRELARPYGQARSMTGLRGR
jgi:hypothetical protein